MVSVVVRQWRALPSVRRMPGIALSSTLKMVRGSISMARMGRPSHAPWARRTGVAASDSDAASAAPSAARAGLRA